MGFEEEWGRLRAEAAQRAIAAPHPVKAGPVARPGAESAAGAVERPSAEPLAAAREAVLERLADFRSRLVLVPLDERGGLWTAELGGLT
ncbi:hypothetical protein [Streptomyces sp. NPDC088762]|uniref:hypothetical protein n=1 Tax=Streptomyces sp. NPDC088762 TaxID=3365891 RepID=UPI0038134E07